jgi:NCS1 family nucleobase:cation symporter-1
MVEPKRTAATAAMDRLYEFEREPVTADKLQPPRYFAGLFAGEHVAGTEFTIGALFVTLGVSTKDVIVGLLLGNLMAVLTWTLVCAPIAVETRLTLYWYLRKIAGPGTTILYNVLNAFLFCILAGCMITVSASAVRIPLGIPAQTGLWLPTDIRFALVAIAIGVVVVTLAILGFRSLAQFAEVCSPWMILMFVAGGIVAIPVIAHAAGVAHLRTLSDFWNLAGAKIWTGKDAAGHATHAFWRVAAFAWICNLAMHGGLSDMAIFRYAKSSWYGLLSAFGMLIGHYMAWIFAGVMGACAMIVLNTTMSKIDPGELAYQALGWAGIVAVVVAGWTTSNPTLYRAGLAFQAVTPGWPRWAVTLAAGAVTTLMAVSPRVFTGLLNFVGVYGLLLAPVGAIVFVEHWIFPRIGLTRYWALYQKRWISWPALATWLLVIALAMLIQRDGDGSAPGYLAQIAYALHRKGLGDFLYRISFLHLWFLFLPVYFLSMVLYTTFAALAGARAKYPTEEAAEAIAGRPRPVAARAQSQSNGKPAATPLIQLARVVTLASLAACIVWPILVYTAGDDFGGQAFQAGWATMRRYFMIPAVVYFVFGTMWAVLREKQLSRSREEQRAPTSPATAA